MLGNITLKGVPPVARNILVEIIYGVISRLRHSPAWWKRVNVIVAPELGKDSRHSRKYRQGR